MTTASQVTMLAQVNSLPRTQLWATVADRNQQTAAEQRRFDVSWHVIATFQRVAEGLILRHRPIHRHFKISADIGVSVLVNSQRGARVLNEDLQHTALAISQLG